MSAHLLMCVRRMVRTPVTQLNARQEVQIAKAAAGALPAIIHSIADGSAENDVKDVRILIS
jgi:hypothetical protein